MKKSWKLILIALLAALLVCTCMSAMAEDAAPGHGTWHKPEDVEHEVNVGWRNPVTVKHHDTCLSSQFNGEWGGMATVRYEAYCITCGYSLGYYEERQEFEPCMPGEPVVVKPTCTEAGSETYTCVYCSKSWSDSIDALGHLPDDGQWHVIIEPTCYSLGWEETVCSRCEKIIGRNIDMILHVLGGKKVKNATCTENEVWQQGCINPGCTYVTGPTWEAKGTALGHIPVEHAEVPAHCETDGMKAYTDCSRCGAVIAGKKEVIPKLGHIYNGTKLCIQEATCQKDGIYVYGCERSNSVCNLHNGYYGELVNEGKVGHLHPETGWEIDLYPTCMTKGYRVNRCIWCNGDPQKEEIPVVDHKYTTWIKDQKAPTCTADGYKVLYCDYNCGTTTTVTIPATGHKAKSAWGYDRSHPDCENAMKGWLECAVCGATLKTVTIPALGHNWQKSPWKDENVEPTCTTPGLYTYRCENHGDPYIADWWTDEEGNEFPIFVDGWNCYETKTEVVPAKGHDYEVKTTPATCTEAGKEVKTCKVCGDVVTTEIPALGHDYQTKTVAATCTTAGSETVACSRCGDVKSSKTIDALGHKAGEAEVTKAATCTEKGTKVTKCTVCGETIKTEEIAALGHKAGDPVVTAATCTKAGSKVTKCSVCGETLKTEEIPALGHKEEVTETAATCTKAGSKVTKCSVCGETLKTEEIPALGHKEEVTETAATCTEAGSKVTKCSVCGETLKTEEIPALGHTAGEPVVTPATCTEAGSEVTKCTVCGEVLETKEIPAPGHVPGKEKIEQNMGNTYCTVCGKLLKQRKISSSSSNNSGSAAPAASAPVIYNGAINAAGIAASELGGNGSSLVTPIDLSTDGAYIYNLVAGDKYVVGTMTVTVISGKATVTYALKSGVTVSAEGLSIFANAEALKAGTATTAAFNAVIDPAGDTKVILAVNLIGSFDVSIADAYTADAAQIATMKALVD